MLFFADIALTGAEWAIISGLTTALLAVSGYYNKLLLDRVKTAEDRATLLDTRLHDVQDRHLAEALEQQKALHAAIMTLNKRSDCAEASAALQRLEHRIDALIERLRQ